MTNTTKSIISLIINILVSPFHKASVLKIDDKILIVHAVRPIIIIHRVFKISRLAKNRELETLTQHEFDKQVKRKKKKCIEGGGYLQYQLQQSVSVHVATNLYVSFYQIPAL